MANLDFSYYGTIEEACQYFCMRLHEYAWSAAPAAQRPKALWAATQIIDTLDFKGYKATVWTLLQEYGLFTIPHFNDCFVVPDGNICIKMPTPPQIRAAEAAQDLEFPRGADTEVPVAIRMAAYEIAYSLLDGKDPELELENLGITSQGYGAVRTSYERNMVPIEHLINGVPNATAWRYLRPFLRDSDIVKIGRIS